MNVAVDRGADETAECRRLAELLNLDAVGVMRTGEGSRRVAWWAVPGSGPLPLHLEDVVQGRADGWIACPRGDDVVFGRLTSRSAVRSVATLTGMLSSLAGSDPTGLDEDGGDDELAGERARWAYAIHDGLTQVVTATVLDLEWMARRAEVEPTQVAAVLSEAAIELRRALEEIRRMLATLTPQEAQEVSLEQLVKEVLERWRLPAAWSIQGDVDSVPGAVRDAASSVIREGVANAAKHADTKDVAVRVQATTDGVQVEVEDRGRGFRAPAAQDANGHLGLEMMRRRVAEVRGTLDIVSAPGEGTRVVARLPVNDQGDSP